MSQTGPPSDEPSEPADRPTFMKNISDAALSSLTSTQKGFIVALRSLDPSLIGSLLREAIAELFPPAHLFSKEICDMPTVWVELRNFLNARGAALTQHSSRRVIMTLAHGIYDDAEDRAAAVEMAQLIIASGRRVRPGLRSDDPPPHSSGPVTEDSGGSFNSSAANLTRLAHNVAMRLKSSKFSGDIGECWMDYVDEYSQISRDYGLSQQQKFQFLHNLLSKDAKRFYLERVQMYAQSYQQAVDMVNQEYNSPVRQTRVKNYLNSLRVSNFVKEGFEISTALAKVYKLITKLSRQVPPSHRGDSHKIEFLRNAAVGYGWSREPLSRVATHNLSFQMLYGELEAALQLDKEADLALARDHAAGPRSSVAKDDSLGVLYTGQGRYGKHPRYVRSKATGYSSQKKKPLDIAGCFNCGDPNHMLKDCSKPINASRAATMRLEYYKKKDDRKHAVHLVLAELCQQIDKGFAESDDESGEPDDVEIFRLALSEDVAQASGPTLLDHESDSDIDFAEIFVLSRSWDSPASDQFEGACVDSGAQKTVIGYQQAEAYCALVNSELDRELNGKRLIFTFGSSKHERIGQLTVRIPVSNSFFLSIVADVVDVDVPFLLGLDVLTKARLILDFEDEVMISKADGWNIPLTRKHGHVYIEWSLNILFTMSELRKVHRHFYHPHPDKVYALMRRADPSNVSSDVMGDLQKITDTCDVCQREANAPHRFRVSMPETDCVFNRTVCVDLMTLDGKTVFHVVDKDTKFNAACFLVGESTKDVWDVFMDIWVSRYVGFPDKISADQGPQFKSTEWKNLLNTAGIKEQPSGVESHNAIGVGERYHSYLRRVYNKVRSDNSQTQPRLALQLAVKAVNDTAGPSGLVPTLLVFGILPRLPITPKELPEHAARMKAMDVACKEMVQISSQARLGTALRSNVPSAADKSYSVGDEVLMYREKPIGKWVGPYVVKDKEGKMLTLDTGDRSIRASIDKLKRYKVSDGALAQTDNDPSDHISDNAGQTPNENVIAEGDDFLMDHPLETTVVTDSSTSLEKDLFDEELLDIMKGIRESELSRLDENTLHSIDPIGLGVAFIGIHITEVLKSGDLRGNSNGFRKAKLAEIRGLKDRKVWKVVPKSSVPADANVLGGRFVLAIKNIGTEDEKEKARYVAQGYKDKDKPYMVHDIPALRASSIRLILSVAAIKGFRVFSHDVNQAYTQSKDKLSRKIFLLPKKEDLELIGITDEELLELLIPLYGVCDAGDYWGVTLEFHVTEDLSMTPTTGDPALYVKVSDGETEGVMGIYVDDNLNAGNEKFEKITAETLEKFDAKPRVYDNFDFFGTMITTTSPGEFFLSQEKHAKRLPIAPKGCSFDHFRKHRAKLSWMAHSRPDLCCSINKAAQVTEDTMSDDKVKAFNHAVKIAKGSDVKGLRFGKLDVDKLVLKCYADAAFATNDDLSSQLGYIILICDMNAQCHILDYSSKKSKRVVRSIMGGEVYSFVDGFDTAFVIRKDLELMLGTKIQLHCFTDSKQLFDSVTKGRQTTEKRLMIDIAGARDAYKSFDITQIGLVCTDLNPADGLSKVKDNGALSKLLFTGIDHCEVEQWITRNESSSLSEEVGV